MGAGQVVGAQFGARRAAGCGARLIEPLMVGVTAGMALRMMRD